MLPVAVTNPPVRKLPACRLPVAVITPPVLMLAPSILPDADIVVPVRVPALKMLVILRLLAFILPNRLTPVEVNVATGVIPATATVTLPLADTLTFELPLMIWLPVATVILVNWLPSPMK